MSPLILLVNPARALVERLVTPLESHGFAVMLANDFEDAAALLKTHQFDAIVTADRLSAHNGLHLILRARALRPELVGVVTAPAADPVLESDAAAFGAVCVVAPWDDSTNLLTLLGSSGVHSV